MITIGRDHRIYVACSPADFRLGIDGHAALCRNLLQQNPFSGHCFIFRNRKRTAVRVLIYHGRGFWLCQKRLSKGQFRHWPSGNGEVVLINAGRLNALLQQ